MKLKLAFTGLLLMFSEVTLANTVNLSCKYSHHLWADIENFGGIEKKVSQETTDKGLLIDLDTSILEFDGVNNIPFQRNSSDIEFALYHDLGDIQFHYLHKVNSITGELILRTRVNPEDKNHARKFPDLDKNGFVTISREIYKCEKTNPLF